jgi:peptide/nickel transport system permease protein
VSGFLLVFALRRALAALAFILLVGTAAFVLVQLAPGDAASHLELSGTSPEAAAAMRARFGLDQPGATQFAQWVRGLARLDLGQSTAFEQPVADLVAARFMKSAVLASTALVLATAIGLPAGVLVAAARRRWAAFGGAISLVLLACPPVVATIALMMLAVRTGWLSVAPGALALPALALALPMAAVLERVQSRASAEALESRGVAAARARGIPPRRLIWVHALRQSLVPVLGVYGIVMAALFSGSVAVETMTSWPGLGQLTVRAVVTRDLFLVTGCAMAVAAMIALAQLAADLLRAVVDPRVREAG